MGNTLLAPLDTCITEKIQIGNVKIGFSEMHGKRTSMEDAHAIEEEEGKIFLGIFDGHSGKKCSKFIANKLPSMILKENNIKKNCLDLDKEYCELKKDDGTTAVFSVIERNKENLEIFDVTIGNVGDSRAIACINGKLKVITKDHTPLLEEEQHRIEEAGGVVVQSRVDGTLAVSRAFGDIVYKQDVKRNQEEQKVIATPDIFNEQLRSGDFIMLFCDGVYEAGFTNEQILSFVQNKMDTSKLDEIMADLCNEALRIGSNDNISVMIALIDDKFIKKEDQKLERTFILGKVHLTSLENTQFRTNLCEIYEKYSEEEFPKELEKKWNEIIEDRKNLKLGEFIKKYDYKFEQEDPCKNLLEKVPVNLEISSILF